jgi:hypothetical protein
LSPLLCVPVDAPPIALAVAVAVVVCWLLADTMTAWPAVVERLKSAVVVSFTTPTATEAPIPALEPLTLPVAVSVAVPV